MDSHGTTAPDGRRAGTPDPEPALPAGRGQSGHAGDARHGHGDQAHHTDHAAQFRDRFWISLVLALPVVLFSEMFAHTLGYRSPTSPGPRWISPVLGTVMFLYGGWPFLTGGRSELAARRPGMMLLIAMAITVAFVASWVTTLGIGGFDLDFWWELALLIVIMLLGHWIEMRALARPSGRWTRWRRCCPTRRSGSPATASVAVAPSGPARSATSCSCAPGGRVPADGDVVDGAAESTSR